MKTLIIVGHEGMLGRMLVDEADRMGLKDDGWVIKGIGRIDMYEFSISSHNSLIPEGSTVINAAGIVKERYDVNGYETVMVNGALPHMIAGHPHVKRIIQVSTDCVFDGRTQKPYSEADQPNPVDLYGRSKLAGELLHETNALTVRTSFIGFGERGLISWLLRQPKDASIKGYQNWPWNGLYARTVARQLLTLALDSDMTGLLHLEGRVLTKFDILERLAKVLRPDITVVPTVSEVSRWMLLSSTRISGLCVPSWIDDFNELRKDAINLGLIAGGSSS